MGDVSDRTEPSDVPHQQLTARNDGTITGERDSDGPPIGQRLHLRPHAGLLVRTAGRFLHEPVPRWIDQLTVDMNV
jgi:hypothetical protein